MAWNKGINFDRGNLMIVKYESYLSLLISPQSGTDRQTEAPILWGLYEDNLDNKRQWSYHCGRLFQQTC